MRRPDFDLTDWGFLPPLDDVDLPEAPPPERDSYDGVMIGSDLASVHFVKDGAADLGEAAQLGLVSVHPGLVELGRLGSLDFDALDAVGRVDAVIAVDRQQAWLQARKQELLGLISVRDSSQKHWCVEEVGAALRLAGGAARTMLADAEQLTQRLPATLQALSDGQLSPEHAAAIVRGSYKLPDELLPAFEQRVLAQAGEQSVTSLKRSIHRAVLVLDPKTAEQKHQLAVADRHVRISPAEDGMAWLTALLPAAEALAVYTHLDNTARAAISTGDGRSLDQFRADALVNGILVGIKGSELPAEQGRQPNINVTVSLTTLLGQDEQPGWLDNYGPISADYARQLAHDPTGTWRRLITDPVSGQLLNYGATRYKPPQHLIDHVTTRDGECAFPFCTHSARRSDLDHIQPYPHGSTSAANLQPLHRRHHNAKTHAGWHNHRNPNGTTHWTSPQGRHYTTRSPQRWTLPDDPPF